MPLKSDQSSAPTPRSSGRQRRTSSSGGRSRNRRATRATQEREARDVHATIAAQCMSRAAEADEVADGQHERIEQARVAARVAVARGPLERMTARGRAREVEVDEDVVERRRPVGRRADTGRRDRRVRKLKLQRGVKQPRGQEHASCGETHVGKARPGHPSNHPGNAPRALGSSGHSASSACISRATNPTRSRRAQGPDASARRSRDRSCTEGPRRSTWPLHLSTMLRPPCHR